MSINDKILKLIIKKIWIVFSLIGVFLLFSSCIQNIEINETRPIDNVEIVNANSRVDVFDEAMPAGVIETYSFNLTDKLEHDEALAFYTVHQYVNVYVADELVYSAMPSEESLRLTKTIGSNWHLITLYTEDDLSDIKVEIIPVYNNVKNRKVDFYVGSELGVYRYSYKVSIPQCVFATFAITLGAIFVILSIYSLKVYGSGKALIELGMCSMALGLWRITDLLYAPFVFKDIPIVVYHISVISLLFGAILLVKSLLRHIDKKNSIALRIFYIISLFWLGLQIVLQMLGIFDIKETLFITHIILVVAVIITIVMTVNNYFKNPAPLISRSNLGERLPMLWVIFASIDLITYFLFDSSTDLIVTLASFFVYIAITGLNVIVTYLRQEQELKEKEVLLLETKNNAVESRITAMAGQIRAHFIFNVLNAVSGMCKSDPEKADEAIIKFSRFLRRNINILEEDKPVLFEEDLKHLEDYISLEQIRFGERVKFEKDIKVSNFMFPSLILQPLVENALKHGLTSKLEGGTIWLKTWEENDRIYISVEDDGKGYDMEKGFRDGAVGIKNVQFRLKHIVNGEMKMESEEGKGTKVTLSIPKEGGISECM